MFAVEEAPQRGGYPSGAVTISALGRLPPASPSCAALLSAGGTCGHGTPQLGEQAAGRWLFERVKGAANRYRIRAEVCVACDQGVRGREAATLHPRASLMQGLPPWPGRLLRSQPAAQDPIPHLPLQASSRRCHAHYLAATPTRRGCQLGMSDERSAAFTVWEVVLVPPTEHPPTVQVTFFVPDLDPASIHQADQASIIDAVRGIAKGALQ